MSRGELNEVSGLPLLVRIAMALNHLVTDFVEQVHKAVERSDRLRPESAIIHTSQLGKPFGPAGSIVSFSCNATPEIPIYLMKMQTVRHLARSSVNAGGCVRVRRQVLLSFGNW